MNKLIRHVIEDFFNTLKVPLPLCKATDFGYLDCLPIDRVKYYKEEDLCPDCVAHPDFPLLVLKYLDWDQTMYFKVTVSPPVFSSNFTLDLNSKTSGTLTGRLPPSK